MQEQVSARLGDWIGEGWKMFVEQWKAWVINTLGMFAAIVIPLGILFALFIVTSSSRHAGQPPPVGLILTAELVLFPTMMLLQAYFIAGLIRSGFKQLRGGRIEFADMLTGGSCLLRLIGAYIVIGFLTIIGALLCIVPAFLVSGLFFFTPHLIVDQGLGPIEAMRRSYEVTRSSMWWFTLFAFVIGLIAGAGSYACYVGMLATYPLSVAAGVIAYRDCFGIQDARSFQAASKPAPDIYTPASYPAPQAVCPHCQAPVPAAGLFCPNCGKPIQP